IVGAGNLGAALAQSLERAGYAMEAVIARSRRESLKRAHSLAEQAGCRPLTDLSVSRANLIWFCVPDAEIGRAARRFEGRLEWGGRVALHSSGALTSDELAVLRSQGASVASVHPLMTFVPGSRLFSAGVSFSAEGDSALNRLARRI